MNSLPLQTRQTLKALGFTENEIKILLLLFQEKKLTSKNISQQTTISFDAVHYSMHSLEKKGIVRRMAKNNEDIVEICSDQRFLEWIESQKQHNGEIYDEAKGILENYLTGIGESAWKPNVIYFEGKQGIIDIYEDMLENAEEIYGWHDISSLHETLGDYVNEFIKKRIAKKIKSYAIMPENKMNKAYYKKGQLRRVKFSKHLPLKGEIRIYADKVAIITFHKKKPVGFVFSGSVMTAVFRAIFEHAWHSGN